MSTPMFLRRILPIFLLPTNHNPQIILRTSQSSLRSHSLCCSYEALQFRYLCTPVGFACHVFVSCRRPPPGMSHWVLPSVPGELSLAILERTVTVSADAVSEVTSDASSMVIACHFRFLHHCYTVGTPAYSRGARSHIAQGISPFRSPKFYAVDMI